MGLPPPGRRTHGNPRGDLAAGGRLRGLRQGQNNPLATLAGASHYFGTTGFHRTTRPTTDACGCPAFASPIESEIPSCEHLYFWPRRYSSSIQIAQTRRRPCTTAGPRSPKESISDITSGKLETSGTFDGQPEARCGASAARLSPVQVTWMPVIGHTSH